MISSIFEIHIKNINQLTGMIRKFVLGIVIFLSLQEVQAQTGNALPDFSVKKGVKNSNVISWVNHFGDDLVQLNIQRSNDSLRNFRTIFSPETTTLPQNGFTDKVPLVGKVFYKIFYMLKGGAYYFTQSKQPFENIGLQLQMDTSSTPLLKNPGNNNANGKNRKHVESKGGLKIWFNCRFQNPLVMMIFLIPSNTAGAIKLFCKYETNELMRKCQA